MFAFYIHTHTDCVDALEMCLGQLKKYFPDHKRYFSINENHDLLKDETVFLYDEETPYTKRLVESLPKVEEDMVLYLHEDMILYDEPKMEEINRCCEFLKEKEGIDTIKLIATLGVAFEIAPSIRVQHGHYGFSVQPSLWKKSSLIQLLEGEDCNIWELEENIQAKFRNTCTGYVYFEGEEQLRGQAHYDSHIFPYTATAIIKGKWNNLEYSSEIKQLMEMYNIKSDREMYQYGPVGSV